MDVSDDLDRLLARGRLSGPQRDRILERVLAKSAAPGRRRIQRAVVIALPLVAAAAVWVLIPKPDEGLHFSAKGGADAGVEATCLGGALSACPAGSTLVFRFDGIQVPAYVHAYATPSPPTAGERVWYFPTSTVAAPQLSLTSGSEVLQKGVLIGPEHTASAYQITVVLSSIPLTKEEVLTEGKTQVIHRETVQLGVVR